LQFKKGGSFNSRKWVEYAGEGRTAIASWAGIGGTGINYDILADWEMNTFCNFKCHCFYRTRASSVHNSDHHKSGATLLFCVPVSISSLENIVSMQRQIDNFKYGLL
jgi:hypothetical protein